jgi:hypothetical protein
MAMSESLDSKSSHSLLNGLPIADFLHVQFLGTQYPGFHSTGQQTIEDMESSHHASASSV